LKMWKNKERRKINGKSMLKDKMYLFNEYRASRSFGPTKKHLTKCL
jgi:hypothetical protein